MEIRIIECTGTSTNILKVLGMYKGIDKLLQGLMDNDYYLSVLDCAVKFNGEWHFIKHCGQYKDDAQKIINKIKKMPAKVRNMPNDKILIHYDAFEAELFINLDGKC